MASNLADIITCAKFQVEIYTGYNFIGVQFSIFLLICAMGLTTLQRYLEIFFTVFGCFGHSPLRGI